jgi:hypothetical protein
VSWIDRAMLAAAAVVILGSLLGAVLSFLRQ